MTDDPAAGSAANWMCNGHVAILDVLGWKGIWRRSDVAQILHAVQRIHEIATAIDRQASSWFQPPTEVSLAQVLATWRPAVEAHGADALAEFDRATEDLQRRLPAEGMVSTETVFLSDTLVIGSWTPTVWGDAVASHVLPVRRLYLCSAIARTLRDCAIGSVPLIFRGTIASGDFLIDQNLILGQAVDDAAELMDEADAAIVWFAPPGFSEPTDRQVEHYLDYEVPLHRGGTVKAQAVNPFFGCHDRDQIDAVLAGMLRAFGDSARIDIVIKRQNTEAFLNHARARWLRYLDSPRCKEMLTPFQNVSTA